MLILALLYTSYGDLQITQTLFLGIKAAVLAIVLQALLNISRKALQGIGAWMIAVLGFCAIFFLAIPFPLLIASAAVIGFFFWNLESSETLAVEEPQANFVRTIAICIVGAVIWFSPILIIDLFFPYPLLSDIGIFFSKLAMVTFGGAYAVLAYMSQEVVTQLGWLTAAEMLDGLGLAETTPGPLILVTEFVGFIAGYKEFGLMGGLLRQVSHYGSRLFPALSGSLLAPPILNN